MGYDLSLGLFRYSQKWQRNKMKAAKLNRREFLKIAGLLPLSYAFQPSILIPSSQAQLDQQNVLILVFDAWSASNMSLYGYTRKTTPHLDRLAEKAIVYHNHYAGSHYTTPGTASLLTGTAPWTHQAFDFNAVVVDQLATKSIFHAFPKHYRLAYTHNPLANTLLRQFMPAIDDFKSWESLYLENAALFLKLFQKDIDTAIVSRNRALKQGDDGYSYSLYISKLNDYLIKRTLEKLEADFPRGVTNNDDIDFFLLEDGIDWLSNALQKAPPPFLGYYHFFPPHDPYNTRADFFGAFESDGYRPLPKKTHFLQEKIPPKNLNRLRRTYDEFILYVDSEFARLYSELESTGLLEKTWIFLTTDHGELFERNFLGHTDPVFYQPIIHIPLVIFPPGQRTRIDIHTNTTAADLLPTISHITGQAVPDWAEGSILPPFSKPNQVKDHDISTIQLKIIDKAGSILQATAMLLRGRYKLMWFFGYEDVKPPGEFIELYDLQSDPEEMNNLYPQEKVLGDELLNVLKAKLADLNRSYSLNR
jgi:arylsulfatase A-like enzyme